MLLCAYMAYIFRFTNTGTVPTSWAHCSKLNESKATVNGEDVCVYIRNIFTAANFAFTVS